MTLAYEAPRPTEAQLRSFTRIRRSVRDMLTRIKTVGMDDIVVTPGYAVDHNRWRQLEKANWRIRLKIPGHEVIEAVCIESGISLACIRGDQRHRAVAWPRQLAMWFLHKKLGASAPVAGRMLGRKDHTTVLHGVKAADNRLQEDAEYYGLMCRVRTRLGMAEEA